MKLKDLLFGYLYTLTLLFGFSLLATVSTLLLDTQVATISTLFVGTKETKGGEEKGKDKVKRYIYI